MSEWNRNMLDEIFKRVDSAVRNERLHEVPDNDGDRGYMNGLRDARRAIERLRMTMADELAPPQEPGR